MAGQVGSYYNPAAAYGSLSAASMAAAAAAAQSSMSQAQVRQETCLEIRYRLSIKCLETHYRMSKKMSGNTLQK